MTRALKCGNCLSWFVPTRWAPGDAEVARNVPVADNGQRDGFFEAHTIALCGLCQWRELKLKQASALCAAIGLGSRRGGRG